MQDVKDWRKQYRKAGADDTASKDAFFEEIRKQFSKIKIN